jgi:hypothetical protein
MENATTGPVTLQTMDDHNFNQRLWRSCDILLDIGFDEAEGY